ncbi:DUF6118 family protein [Devosia neptuniae]|uniref:DUF6118 family protein n=1 Tax=Devosia neptuniae TaxID=191302 RepID=UPI0022AE66CD|nr:DUF6118 family protein [Devosia neptuniae]MCZ4348162.1 DUF6118 family protein [Devosia neptuniae]
MTDDDGEPFEPENLEGQEDAAGDPAQAFEALRQAVETQGMQIGAEMTVIRKGVEAAFEQFEKFQQPADYSADLGQIVQQLAQVGLHLEAVEKSPILKNGPEHYARALERSGESVVKTAAQQLENESRDLQRMARDLAGHLDSARERHVQNRYVWGIGAAGVVVGILATLFLPAILPFSAAPRVASFIMAESPWRSGMNLMAFASPADWDRVAAADQLIEANKAEVAVCREAATEAGRDQRCTITVAAPAALPAQ